MSARRRTRRAYQAVVDEHLRRVWRLTEGRGIGPMRKLHAQAQAEVAAKLRGLLRRGLGDTYTAHVHRIVLGQLRAGQMSIAGQLAGELSSVSRDAQTEALRSVAHDVRRLERHFSGAEISLPIEEAARFRGVIDRRRTSLLRQHDASIARWGASTVSKVEQQLGLSLAVGETTGQAVDRLEQATGAEWWRAERIVRTETAWAYAATAADGYAEAAKDLPDLRMRWSEHVDDDTREPLDDRVGADSIAMHGQVARPGGLFTMPQDPDVSPKMWGLQWSFPPNRPNDRAVLAPWRPGWEIPAWEYRGGRRANL